MNPIRKILNQYRSLGLFEVEELAGMLCCSARRIYGIIEEDDKCELLKAHELIVLQHYFASMGRYELVNLSVPEKHTLSLRRGFIQTNGTIVDEMRDAVNCISEIDRSATSRDLDTSIKKADELVEIAHRYKEELKSMRG